MQNSGVKRINVFRDPGLLPSVKRGKVICFIDEAGRGPLAGPVWIGVVAMKMNRRRDIADVGNAPSFSGCYDSKQCTKRHRAILYQKIAKQNIIQQADFYRTSAHKSARFIDSHGIISALRESIVCAVIKVMKQFSLSSIDDVVLVIDGNSDFHLTKIGYEVIPLIRGDALLPALGAASIIAKVERDEYMVRLAHRYKQYGFDVHMGYGTRMHREKIVQYGPSKEHRKSFLTSLCV